MENIIFLVSQPRAGSTLLQKILAQDTKIVTTGEPWVLLPFLYGFDFYELINKKAEFDAHLSRRAIVDFINKYENFDLVYKKSLSLFLQNIYSSFPGMSEGNLFLDKTPRYYYIIEMIEDLFPHCKKIFLIRNPISVLNSILKSWIKNDYFKLGLFSDDLFLAPELLHKKLKNLNDSDIIVRYEDMVSNPLEVLTDLFNKLELEFNVEYLNYNEKDKIGRWRLGDVQNVYNRKTLTNESLLSWKDSLKNYKHWVIINYYFQKLGPEIIEGLGYSFSEIKNVLSSHRPSWLKRHIVFPRLYFSPYLLFIGKAQRKKSIIKYYINKFGLFKTLKTYFFKRKLIKLNSSFEDII